MVALLFTFLLQVSTLICHPDVAAKRIFLSETVIEEVEHKLRMFLAVRVILPTTDPLVVNIQSRCF